MKNRSKFRSGAVKAALILSSLTVIQLAYAAETQERRWGGVEAYRTASSAERVSHFKNNLTPHDNIRYSDDAYHKTIVQLNWFDQGRSRSAIVNQNRSFDIFGLFEGESLILSSRAMAILDDLAAAMGIGRINTRKYVIAAHAVSKESEKGNQQLSEKRARLVKAYLKARFNISDKRLVPIGFGSHSLKDRKNVEVTKNNRIEIALIEDIYGFTPNTNIKLPDASSSRTEGIMVTTSGSQTLVIKEDKSPRRLAYARKTESHKTRTMIKKISKAKRKVARRQLSKTTEYSARQTSRMVNKKRRTAHNSGARNARVAAHGRVANHRSPYGTRTARGPHVQATPYAAYDRGYAYADDYDAYQSGGTAYSYGGYGEQNVRCQ